MFSITYFESAISKYLQEEAAANTTSNIKKEDNRMKLLEEGLLRKAKPLPPSNLVGKDLFKESKYAYHNA
jgi:hypothetical protein